MWVLAQVQVKWCPEQPDLVGDGDVPDHGGESLDLQDWCPNHSVILWFHDSLEVQPCRALKELPCNSNKAKKIILLFMFSNLKRSGGSPRTSPLKNYLFFKVFSLSPSCIFPLLILFLISFFIPLFSVISLQVQMWCFPCTPAAPGPIPGSQGQFLLPSPDIPNNPGTDWGCALNLPLHITQFNDLLSLLWQRNKGSHHYK